MAIIWRLKTATYLHQEIPAAIEQAQARAAQCLASDYQDCGG